MKCTMDKDINTCPFVSEDKAYCNHPNPMCSFVEKPEVEPKIVTNPYVRKERWYEKYYRKR